MRRGFLGSSKKEPADSRTICKSTREASIDTLQAVAIDSVNQASNDTIHPMSENIVHSGTVHLDTVHPASIDTVHHVHPASIDPIHPAPVDTVHPASNDLVHCDTVHPDTVHPVKNNTTCEETENIKVLILKVDENGMLRDEEGEDPFQGLPNQDPRNHIAELEDLVSRSEENEVSEYHMLCKIFSYSISEDAFS
ncbi:hypothetical protein F2Q68_00044350 [Brassica cretica]|uniref:Uncharacterized protein n=2 Tax=Brassica cretica TaxID=69181 RepID=A0A8S9LHU4_BRACR|nr:hypothetical protein F2Q68_00044350 [Brassica cretica]KAF3520281.1 hypothetical protein DY000_02060420 [Brassica cretica]